MKRIGRLLIGMTCVLQLSCARAEPPAATRVAESPTQVRLCVPDGKLDVAEVRLLRNDITSSGATRDHLLALVARLADGSRSCADSTNIVSSATVASLHTLLADRLLDAKEYNRAINEYSAADGIFERAGPPDIMWLRALEGRAEGEMAMGRRGEAKETAARATRLARSWARDPAKRFMLVQALRAEARIYIAERPPAKASELSAEADQLESAHD
jgi:hypothetical protein